MARPPTTAASGTTAAAFAATLLLAACSSTDNRQPDIFTASTPRGDWRELRVSLDRDAQYTGWSSSTSGCILCPGSPREISNRWSNAPSALLNLELTFDREVTAAELEDARFDAAIDGIVYPIAFHDLMIQDRAQPQRWTNAEQFRIGHEMRIRIAAAVPCVRVRVTDKIVDWPPTTHDDLLRARTGARSAMQTAPAATLPAPANREARILDTVNCISNLHAWTPNEEMTDAHWPQYVSLARRLQLEDDEFVIDVLERYPKVTPFAIDFADQDAQPFALLRVMFDAPTTPHPDFGSYKGWVVDFDTSRRSASWPVRFENGRFAIVNGWEGSKGMRYVGAEEFKLFRERLPFRDLNSVDPAQDPAANANTD